jgi:hypothetical protein
VCCRTHTQELINDWPDWLRRDDDRRRPNRERTENEPDRGRSTMRECGPQPARWVCTVCLFLSCYASPICLLDTSPPPWNNVYLCIAVVSRRRYHRPTDQPQKAPWTSDCRTEDHEDDNSHLLGPAAQHDTTRRPLDSKKKRKKNAQGNGFMCFGCVTIGYDDPCRQLFRPTDP